MASKTSQLDLGRIGKKFWKSAASELRNSKLKYMHGEISITYEDTDQKCIFLEFSSWIIWWFVKKNLPTQYVTHAMMGSAYFHDPVIEQEDNLDMSSLRFLPLIRLRTSRWIEISNEPSGMLPIIIRLIIDLIYC